MEHTLSEQAATPTQPSLDTWLVASRHYFLWLALGLGVSFATVVLIGVSVGDVTRSVRVLPLIAAVGCVTGGWVLQGLMLAVLVRPHAHGIRLRDLALANLKIGFVGAVTPFGGAELPYAVYLVRQLGVPAAVAGSVVVTKGVVNVLVLLAGAATVVARTPAVFQVNLPIVLAAAALLAAGGGLLRSLRHRRSRAEKSSRRRWRDQAVDFALQLEHGVIHQWRCHPVSVVSCFGLTALYWTATLLLGPLTLLALGWNGSWWSIIAAQVVLYTLLPLSPTPGGAGAAELGYAALIAAHVPAVEIAGAVVLWRLATFYLPLAAGALVMARPADNEAPRRPGEARSDSETLPA